MLPVYGMTETTSITTISRLDDPREVIVSGRAHPSRTSRSRWPTSTPGRAAPGRRARCASAATSSCRATTPTPRQRPKVIDAEGWFHTGDLGDFDDSGYLAITGRKSDMFIVGGATPTRPRSRSHCPSFGVRQAYIVGVPDERLGEVGFAFVERAVPTCPRMTSSGSAAAAWPTSRSRVSCDFVDEWPLTATGKIERFRLSEMARDHAGARV